jgi:hypothetical protein
VSTTSLTFTASNWNTPQIITVTGLQDFVSDGTQAYSVIFGAVASSDPAYAGIDPGDVALNNSESANLAPTIAYAAGAQSFLEDRSLIFSSLSARAIVLSDLDAGVQIVELNLSVSSGQITLGATTGLSFVSGGNGANAMVLRATVASLNAALEGLTVTPLANFNGALSLDLQVNDLGNTGMGGPTSASLSIPLTVASVNDAPLTLNGTATLPQVAEGDQNPAGRSVGTIFSGLFADAADTGDLTMNQFAGVAVRAYPQNQAEGSWQYSLNGGASWLGFGSLSDSAALKLSSSDLIRFLPTGSFAGTPSSTLSVRLLDNSTPFASGTAIDVSVFTNDSAFSSALVTLSTGVTPSPPMPVVNHAPSIISNSGGVNAGVGTAQVVFAENSAAPILQVAAEDVDLPGDPLRYSLTGGADQSLFVIDPVSGVLSLAQAARPLGLDFETPKDSNGDGIYVVEVTVSDGAGGFDRQTIHLTVQDLNEAPSDLHAALKLNLNHPTEPIATILTSDQDKVERFTYTLLDNPGQVFTLDSASGMIGLSSIGQGLINSGRTESLTVLVNDKGGLQAVRTFSLKMPFYFPPELSSGPVAPRVGVITPTRLAEVVIVAGVTPGTASSSDGDIVPPDSNLVSSGLPITNTSPGNAAASANLAAPGSSGKPRTMLGILSKGEDFAAGPDGTKLDSSELDPRLAGPNAKSRNARFEEPVLLRVSRQYFDIVIAGNGRISEYGELATFNPHFDVHANAAILSLAPQPRFSGQRPSIDGQLQAAEASSAQNSALAESFGKLFSNEPILMASALISAGAVWWGARGLALATSMLVGAPAWRQIDVLPIVLSRKMQGSDTPIQNDSDALLNEDTLASTLFFNAENDDLEEQAVGSLFERR